MHLRLLSVNASNAASSLSRSSPGMIPLQLACFIAKLQSAIHGFAFVQEHADVALRLRQRQGLFQR